MRRPIVLIGLLFVFKAGVVLSLAMKRLLAIVAVVATVAVTYLSAVRYEFVTLDDVEYVTKNDHVRGGVSAANLKWAFESCGYSCNWHPLTWVSHQVDATVVNAVWGKDRLDRLSNVMHLHNLLLHGANAGLLLLLMLLMSKGAKPLVPALLTLVWALHPLRTEVVCWVSERKELLCVFWMLAAMIFWALRARVARSGVPYGLSLVCFALAVLAKPLAVSLPVVLFVWEWALSEKPFAQSLLRVLPFAVLSCACAVLTLQAQVEAVEVGAQYSLCEKVQMTLAAPVIYLQQTVLPVGLSAVYPGRLAHPWPYAAIGLVLVAMMATVCVGWLFCRGRAVAIGTFGVAWVYVSLLPMLGIVKVGDQPHSDRYTYWGGAAFVGILSVALQLALRRHSATVARLLGVSAAVLACLTLCRMSVWRNSLALYTDAVSKSWMAQPAVGLCRELRKLGPEGEKQAEQMLCEVLQRCDDSDVHAEYAHLLVTMNREMMEIEGFGPDSKVAEARLSAEKAIAVDPKQGVAHEALGFVRFYEGKWEEGRKCLLRAKECGEDPERIDAELEAGKKYLSDRGKL